MPKAPKNVRERFGDEVEDLLKRFTREFGKWISEFEKLNLDCKEHVMATKKAKTTKALIKEIDTLSKQAMSRGRIILDEDVNEIRDLLWHKHNIKVTMPTKRMKDEEIMRELIGNRIFITNNSKDFAPYAAETETWIISTEHVKPYLQSDELAKLVSDTIRQLQLFSKRIQGGMLITLNRKGPPTVKVIND